MLNQTTVIKNRAELKFMPIYLDSLVTDSILDFDLYIKANQQLVLYRSANLAFTDRTRQKLLENKVDRLFVSLDNRGKYQRYIEQNLPRLLTEPTIQQEKKAAILYDTSTNLVKELLANPTLGENIQRSKDLVSSTMGFILRGREAFLNLLKITSFDYYTYTHSVNVCTFSIALAQQMGFTDEEFLYDLGVGALLHDVGKSRISDRIINKRTTLTPIEFEIMKKHPKFGVDILTETNLVAQNSYFPVLQHHERGDRRGYPNGLSLDDMHLYSRIVAICDSFDAMTTERVYQRAMDTYPALKVMFACRGGYDEQMLRAFCELMGPTGLLEI